jgi:hypothetical protein
MSLISSSPQLEPEFHQSKLWVPSSHISYQLDLFPILLVRMMVGTLGFTSQ